MKNTNKSLYWYGLGARGVKFLGKLIMACSIPILFFTHWILAIIVFIFGILIFFKGCAMRFDYKMQSGSIIHKGDWN